MAVPLKFLQFFQSLGGYGWTEVHYKLAAGSAPNLKVQLDNFFINVGLTRAQLLGEDCRTIGARVSYRRDGAIASKPRKNLATGEAGQRGASPALSLAVNFCDTSNTKNKIVHLRGFWDSVENNEFYDPDSPAAAGWTDRFDIWKAALIGGQYGWLSKDAETSAKGVVTNYVVGNTGIVTFTLAPDGMPLATVNSQVQVRFSKLNRSGSVLNRSILCNVVGRQTLTSVAPFAAGPFVSSGRFNYRGVGFVQYDAVNAVSLGRRQMGKPLSLSPARGRVKPTT